MRHFENIYPRVHSDKNKHFEFLSFSTKPVLFPNELQTQLFDRAENNCNVSQHLKHYMDHTNYPR